jgi:alpha-D-ribose 1-methylphosphonate 5-triphosphate synthase subunit PhnG
MYVSRGGFGEALVLGDVEVSRAHTDLRRRLGSTRGRGATTGRTGRSAGTVAAAVFYFKG